jgi:hypothetical protein
MIDLISIIFSLKRIPSRIKTIYKTCQNCQLHGTIYDMGDKRDYPILITVNHRKIFRVVIDTHYEEKHKDSIDDQIILQLVEMLDNQVFEAEAQKDGFQYFKTEPLEVNGLNYRLIWLLENDEIYIGVVNAFRR